MCLPHSGTRLSSTSKREATRHQTRTAKWDSWEMPWRRGFLKESLKNSVAEWGQQGRGLGASSLGGGGGHGWKWELRSPFPFCKMREVGVQSPNSAAQTFLDVPSGAFPDSRRGSYSKSRQIPSVLPSEPGWARTVLESLFSAPRLFCLPTTILQHAGSPNCQNRGSSPPVLVSLLGAAPPSLQMSPPASHCPLMSFLLCSSPSDVVGRWWWACGRQALPCVPRTRCSGLIAP